MRPPFRPRPGDRVKRNRGGIDHHQSGCRNTSVQRAATPAVSDMLVEMQNNPQASGMLRANGSGSWPIETSLFHDHRVHRAVRPPTSCMRAELLDETLFRSLPTARAISEAWRYDINSLRNAGRFTLWPQSISSTIRMSTLKPTPACFLINSVK